MKKFFILLLKPLSFIPALCMMYLIFSFSGQSGEQSGALSQKISREIVVVADKALDKILMKQESSITPINWNFRFEKLPT